MKCMVCEQMLVEHTDFRGVYYCNNPRCTRGGLLSVFVLTPVPKEEPKEIDDKGLPKP